ncbi:MAG: plastocyanin/azurin family copper-binding protein [Chloroflexota bacterium]
MKRLTVLMVLILTAVFIAACGGGEDTSGPETFTFDVTGLDEFVYDPASLTVSAGSLVTINFENVGVLEHNWLLISERTEPVDATEADAMAGATTGELGAGESKSITFSAPPAGTYTYVCTVAGHAEAGMLGTLVIE